MPRKKISKLISGVAFNSWVWEVNLGF